MNVFYVFKCVIIQHLKAEASKTSKKQLNKD
jgi:hypothetical protein